MRLQLSHIDEADQKRQKSRGLVGRAALLFFASLCNLPVLISPALCGPAGFALTPRTESVLERHRLEPLAFVEGTHAEGQAFAASVPGMTFSLEPAGITVTTVKPRPTVDRRDSGLGAIGADIETVGFRLLGANLKARLTGMSPLPAKAHFLRGADSRLWRRGVTTYGSVLAQEVYPGIDVVYYGNGHAFEHDFIVKPGADPEAIRLGLEGAKTVELSAKGELLLHTSSGPVTFKKPLLYQEAGGGKRVIAGAYRLGTDGTVSFEVGEYERGKPLVIDPVLELQLSIGGSADDGGAALAFDTSGNVYLAGWTWSVDFPVAGSPYSSVTAGLIDVVVLKLSPTGTLLYSTYLGGSDVDFAHKIAVDASGSAWVVGYTNSGNFPLANPAQPSSGGSYEGFVTQLDPSGASLTFSTYLGGANGDFPDGIVLDQAGNVYVAGWTSSPFGFPMVNAIQTEYRPSFDAFVTKYDVSRNIVFSTYLGGFSDDYGGPIAVDQAGNIYLAGSTVASSFPTTAGSRLGAGGTEAFIAKIDGTNYNLIYSTYFGGSGNDGASAIAVGPSGDVWVAGATLSPDFPLENPYQASLGGGQDLWLTRFDSTLTEIRFSTYLGGSGNDSAPALALDGVGNAYLASDTASPDFPVWDALQPVFGGATDGYVSKIAPAGQLVWSTYLGGPFFDHLNTVGLSSGAVWAAGPGIRLMKIGDDSAPPVVSNVVTSPTPAALGAAVSLTALADDTGSAIASAEYHINGGPFEPMLAADGDFDEVSEVLDATLTGLPVGVHSICVRATDGAGNASAEECILLAVYDPSAGFVTGGGSVASPSGADLQNPDASGPAMFGFVSKYLPGAQTPSGDLQFRFKAGDLELKSTSMEWLVVTGEPRARFQGLGLINGSQECRFEVDSWDGSAQPGDSDAFGIRIFGIGPGGERYSLPATPLTQGSIIIHRK